MNIGEWIRKSMADVGLGLPQLQPPVCDDVIEHSKPGK